MMTGEPLPVETAVSDTVTGGTIALSGRLVVRAVQVGEHTQLAQLIALVGRAQADKAAIQRLADRVCGVFVPLVLAAAALTLVELARRRSRRRAGVQREPGRAHHRLPVRAGPGHASRAGGGVRSRRATRHLHQGAPGAGVVRADRSPSLLDKTGTVTSGRMTVTALAAEPGTEPAELLRHAAAVERASEHPVAAAVCTAWEEAAREGLAAADGSMPEVDAFRALPGLGVRGVVEGRQVVVGRERLLRDRGIAIPPRLASHWAQWEQAKPDRGPGRLGR